MTRKLRKRGRVSTRSAWSAHAAHHGDHQIQSVSNRFAAGRSAHDALENSCCDLARYKYKIELYKADAEAVKIRNSKDGEPRFVTRCKSGIPDRIAVIPPTGRFAGFEFKTGASPVRDNQARVHNAMIASGAAIYTIRSVAEFETFLAMLIRHEKDKKLWQEIGQSQAESA